MKTWDAFFRDLMPTVRQCPEPTAEHALLRAAQKFCDKTGVWRIWLDNVTTRANATEYDLPLEPRTELVKLIRATLAGRIIDVRTTEEMPDDWRTNTAGIRDCVFTPDKKTAVLLPAQAAGLILRLEASLKPSNQAEGVEDFIHDEYAEVIAKGARASLLMHDNQPYSNAAMGSALEKEFTDQLASIALTRFRGFSSAMPRARAKTF